MLRAMKERSDGDLMMAIAKGDRKAFTELFDRHGQLVLGYARRLLSDSSLAEDASQETWIRVVRASARYEEKMKFRSWLLRIVRNCSLDILENRKSFHQSLDNNDAAEEFSGFEAEKLNDERLAEIKAAIDRLPDAQRVVITIWIAEESSYEQMAQDLKTSVSAIKSLLFRAKRNLEIILRGGQSES